MLELRGLEVRYGSIVALRDVDLDVARGECVALVGPNGAGKSSMLRAIAGLHGPTAGTVTFCGERIDSLVPEAVRRRGIAYVPEGRAIFASLTVEENLLLGATVRRENADVARDIEGELERFPRLRDRLDRPAGLLSGGEQQMLAISRALVGHPTLVLLDEPSLGLAPRIVDLVFEALEALRKEDVTILLVEQNASRAIALADRTYVLRSGQIARQGRSGEFSDDEIIAEYLGSATGGDPT